jgi:transketolase
MNSLKREHPAIMPLEVESLETVSKELRRDIVSMTHRAASGHPGGSLSEIDILTALYFNVLNIDPENPYWSDRDRFVLSKAHACPGLYAVLSRRGFFPHEELATFRKIDSRLQGHAHTKTPGVEMSGGSLGQGLSFGVGLALGARLRTQVWDTWVLIGDGECDEGQIWEAAMSASHYGLSNLKAIVDRNRIQNDRTTDEVMKLEPLVDKWRAFGWKVFEVDGHAMSDTLAILHRTAQEKSGPVVVIAHTVKGKGVSFMENNPAFHGAAPNDQELMQALRELD